jgi:hypothetical protein
MMLGMWAVEGCHKNAEGAGSRQGVIHFPADLPEC